MWTESFLSGQTTFTFPLTTVQRKAAKGCPGILQVNYTHVTIHPCRLCARPFAGLMIGWQSEVREMNWPIKQDGAGPETQEVCL